MGEFLTEKRFSEVCTASASRSSLLPIRKKWEDILGKYRERLVRVSEKQKLTMSLIRTILSGVDISGETNKSFLGIWEEVIEGKRKEERAGTAENYGWALNSFRKILGDVEGFSVNKEVIEKWNDGMKNGVVRDGKLVGKIADATRGMYLRTCRVIWNECVKQGFLTNVEYPFSNKNNSLISIPRGKLRQQSYLNVQEMTELYNVFIEKRYPENWGPIYIERAHQSLGLFLAQYLCNGFNLADAARLRYNSTYWNEGGKAFEFMRKKTAARSNNMSVVIVPIIPPLQKILDEKADYEDSKSTVDGIATVANVLSFFLDGGIVTNALIAGAKHLITGGMASDMQENVLEARKSYISDVLQSMELNIENQFSSIENSLKQQLSDNELKFRNDVEK